MNKKFKAAVRPKDNWSLRIKFHIIHPTEYLNCQNVTCCSIAI